MNLKFTIAFSVFITAGRPVLAGDDFMDSFNKAFADMAKTITSTANSALPLTPDGKRLIVECYDPTGKHGPGTASLDDDGHVYATCSIPKERTNSQ